MLMLLVLAPYFERLGFLEVRYVTDIMHVFRTLLKHTQELHTFTVLFQLSKFLSCCHSILY